MVAAIQRRLHKDWDSATVCVITSPEDIIQIAFDLSHVENHHSVFMLHECFDE